MESFSSQWLESINRQRIAPLFASHGYSTFAKCSQLSEQDLDVMGVTNDNDRKYLLKWAGKLQGRAEAQVTKELPVSVVHTELSIVSSIDYNKY